MFPVQIILVLLLSFAGIVVGGTASKTIRAVKGMLDYIDVMFPTACPNAEFYQPPYGLDKIGSCDVVDAFSELYNKHSNRKFETVYNWWGEPKPVKKHDANGVLYFAMTLASLLMFGIKRRLP
jgi:hypothetical protein